MKRTRFTLVLLIAVVAAQALYAQSASMTITIPFKFTVADSSMPAGQYVVKGIYRDAIAIQHAQGDAGVILVTHRSDLPLGNRAQLIFHQYGGLYFLAEVQLPGAVSVQTFATGKEELEVARFQKRQQDVEVGQ